MVQRRKDSKGRVLNKGESQRKDGRYQYRYIDPYGVRKTIYDLDLNNLRKKERVIQKDLDDHIKYKEGQISVSALLDMYISLKTKIRPSTLQQYIFQAARLKENPLCRKQVNEVFSFECKKLFADMAEEGFAYQTIAQYKRLLKSAFQIAVDDDLIRKNPCDFKLSQVVPDDSKKKKPLTTKQVNELLGFVQNDFIYQKYYDTLIVLLGTGMRISEFCGLTLSDIDIKHQVIHVSHQALYCKERGVYIEETKTESGKRDIPMTDDVYLSMIKIMSRRLKQVVVDREIDGHNKFLCVTNTGRPVLADHYRAAFLRIKNKYNSISKDAIESLSPHILRHTFCTNYSAAGLSIKSLQYLMGHADASTTLDIYTDFDFDSIVNEFKKISCLCFSVA